MSISKNFEQAIFVLLILATQRDQTPLKSTLLSRILQVSDSSLKKILRKLVLSNLIKSSASKDGGFELVRKIEDISLFCVLSALSDDKNNLINLKISNLSRQIFNNKEHIKQSEQKVLDRISLANNAFCDELKKLSLVELLQSDYKDNLLDWNEYDSSKMGL